MTTLETMTVSRIVRYFDRILLYSQTSDRYHVIAPPDCKVLVGDRIEFELHGHYFGWFVRIVENLVDMGEEKLI